MRAADEVIAGKLDDHFPLVVWQTGSGTQSNMNANEVIANRAIELAGGVIGSKKPIHPNDDVNRSQSSNDVFPTVMHVAAALEIRERLLPAVAKLRGALEKKSDEFRDIVKVGRTHLMDATPLTLGQELSGWAAQLAFCERQLEQSLDGLYELALGGTAVGHGAQHAPQVGGRRREEDRGADRASPSAPRRTSSPRSPAHEALVAASGALRTLAVACFKIASDVRLLGSGPRCGIGELHLPENEPGSSIMPGKVNPTQCRGDDDGLRARDGQRRRRSASPGRAGTSSSTCSSRSSSTTCSRAAQLLADACHSFTDNCVVGIEANRDVIAKHLENTLMLVTALNEVIGYDNAAKVAKLAHTKNITLRAAAARARARQAARTSTGTCAPRRWSRPAEPVRADALRCVEVQCRCGTTRCARVSHLAPIHPREAAAISSLLLFAFRASHFL